MTKLSQFLRSTVYRLTGSLVNVGAEHICRPPSSARINDPKGEQARSLVEKRRHMRLWMKSVGIDPFAPKPDRKKS